MIKTADLSTSAFTLTRLPAGHPIADGRQAPLVVALQLSLLVILIICLGLQLRFLKPKAASMVIA